MNLEGAGAAHEAGQGRDGRMGSAGPNKSTCRRRPRSSAQWLRNLESGMLSNQAAGMIFHAARIVGWPVGRAAPAGPFNCPPMRPAGERNLGGCGTGNLPIGKPRFWFP